MQKVVISDLTQSFSSDNAALIQFNKLFNKSDKIRFLTKYGTSVLKENTDANKSLIKSFICSTLNENPSNVSHAFLAAYREHHGIESPNETRLNSGTGNISIKRVSYKKALVVPIDVPYIAPALPTLIQYSDDMAALGVDKEKVETLNAAKLAAYEETKQNSVSLYAAQIRAALTDELLMQLITDYANKVINPTAANVETANDDTNTDDTANDTQSDDNKPF